MRELATRLHRYIDEFTPFPGFPGIAGECDLEAVPDFFAAMKRSRFELAVQMHGAGEIANPLGWLLLATHLGAPPREDVGQTLREARELLAKAA